MLKLKLQYFGHLVWRADTLEKTLKLGKIEGRRRRGPQRTRCWMASSTQWTWVWATSGRWWRTGKPGVLQSMGFLRVRHDWVTEEQQCTGAYFKISLWYLREVFLCIFVVVFDFTGQLWPHHHYYAELVKYSNLYLFVEKLHIQKYSSLPCLFFTFRSHMLFLKSIADTKNQTSLRIPFIKSATYVASSCDWILLRH